MPFQNENKLVVKIPDFFCETTSGFPATFPAILYSLLWGKYKCASRHSRGCWQNLIMNYLIKIMMIKKGN